MFEHVKRINVKNIRKNACFSRGNCKTSESFEINIK